MGPASIVKKLLRAGDSFGGGNHMGLCPGAQRFISQISNQLLVAWVVSYQQQGLDRLARLGDDVEQCFHASLIN